MIKNVSSYTPQGLQLSVTTFITGINDIISVIKFLKFFTYVDDIKFYKELNVIDLPHLHHDLDSINRLTCRNDSSVNTHICESM